MSTTNKRNDEQEPPEDGAPDDGGDKSDGALSASLPHNHDAPEAPNQDPAAGADDEPCSAGELLDRIRLLHSLAAEKWRREAEVHRREAEHFERRIRRREMLFVISISAASRELLLQDDAGEEPAGARRLQAAFALLDQLPWEIEHVRDRELIVYRLLQFAIFDRSRGAWLCEQLEAAESAVIQSRAAAGDLAGARLGGRTAACMLRLLRKVYIEATCCLFPLSVWNCAVNNVLDALNTEAVSEDALRVLAEGAYFLADLVAPAQTDCALLLSAQEAGSIFEASWLPAFLEALHSILQAVEQAAGPLFDVVTPEWITGLQTALHIDRDSLRAALELEFAAADALLQRQVRQRDKKTEARDKWLYDQCQSPANSYKQIRIKLKTKAANKGWGLIGSDQGVQQAARRYAERNKLPAPPSRKDD